MMSKIKATAVVVSTWGGGGGGGGGGNFDNVFLVNDEREDPNTTKSGPSLACQQNTI